MPKCCFCLRIHTFESLRNHSKNLEHHGLTQYLNVGMIVVLAMSLLLRAALTSQVPSFLPQYLGSQSPASTAMANNKMSQPPITPEQIQAVINQVRQNPKSLVPHIQAQLNKFKDQMQMEMSPSFYYSTNEGRGAWEEAIEFLTKQEPLAPYQLHNGLSKAALDHAIDLANHNLMGHTGSDGSSMQDRITRYCRYTTGYIGENVAQEFAYKGRDHALESVVGLIIDDGVKNRGHRNAVFSTKYRYFGSGSARSSQYILTVIDYCSENCQQKTGVTQAQTASQFSSKQDEDVPGGFGGSNSGSNGGFSGGWSSQGGSWGGMGGMGGMGNMGGMGGMGGFGGMQFPGMGGMQMQGRSGNGGFGMQGFGMQDFSDQGWNVVPASQNQPKPSGGGGGRYVVSTNSSTQTKTVNGVRTTKTIITKVYNDGTKEVEQNEQTSNSRGW